MLIDKTTIKPGESLNGFLLRVAERNGMAQIKQLLAPFNIKPRISYSEEQVARIAAELEWDVEELLRVNPRYGATVPRFNARFMPARRTALCPHCLKEADHLQTAWDNVLITACTKHKNLLVDRCPNCLQHLTHERVCVRYCDCGQDLAQIKTEQADPYLVAISAKLLGQQVPELEYLPEGLRQQTPEDLDGFLWYLHCYSDIISTKQVMSRPYPSTTADAVRIMLSSIKPILEDWPQGFYRLLKNLEEKAEGDSAGISKQLGHWYRMLFTKYGSESFQWIHDAFARYVTEHFAGTLNARTSRIPRGLSQIKGWVSVSEAKIMLGVQGQRIRVALDNGDIEGIVRTHGPDRDYCFVRRADIERIKHARSAYWTGREVCRQLAITKTQLQRLVEAGAFSRYEADQRPPLVEADYLSTEVQGFMQKLEDSLESKLLKPENRKSLSDILVSRAANAQQVLRVYQAVVRGELKPRDIIQEKTGLARFIFDADEINEVNAVDLGGTTLTMTQVCEITGWKADAVVQWVRAGLLPARHVPNGASKATLIRVDALVRFMQQYLVLAGVASAGGSKSKYLIQALEAAGCTPVSFRNEKDVRFAVLLPYQELSTALKSLRPLNDGADSRTGVHNQLQSPVPQDQATAM